MNAPLTRYRLWDPAVRLFHWTLVLLILLQWGTAEWHWLDMEWHKWFGYATLALIVFRIAWGFVGSQSARFGEFLRGPKTVLAYALTLDRREPEGLPGHNPIGGWSVIALLACVLVQAVTGLFSGEEDEAFYGPLAGWLSSTQLDFVTDVHEENKNILLVLIAVHLLGVVWHLVVKRENLIGAMISGTQRFARDPGLRFAGPVRALVVLAIACAAVWAVVVFGAP